MSKSEPTMPFGKFKDKPLAEVPRWYLSWLSQNCELRGWLREAVDAVLEGQTIPERRAPKVERPWTPAPGKPWYHE